jgi:hypothetical protein
MASIVNCSDFHRVVIGNIKKTGQDLAKRERKNSRNRNDICTLLQYFTVVLMFLGVSTENKKNSVNILFMDKQR